MEVIMKIDTKNPEAKAFYKYSKSLPFVKTSVRKELSDEETQKITQQMGEISNANMTNRFLLERFKKKNKSV